MSISLTPRIARALPVAFGPIYRDLMINAAGAVLPVVAALVSIPYVLAELGAAKFGVLSIAYVIVGYFSLFDLGIGKALTHSVSGAHNTSPAGIATDKVVNAGLQLLLCVGISTALLLWVLAEPLVHSLVTADQIFVADTVRVLKTLAVTIPFVVISTGLRGILEGQRRFVLVNVIRVPVGVLTYTAPVLVLQVSDRLSDLVIPLALVRVLSFCALAVAVFTGRQSIRLYWHAIRAGYQSLFSFGAWITVSHLVGPLLLYGARFALLIIVSTEAVTHFVVPYEVVSKYLLFSSVLVTTLYPVIVAHVNEPGAVDQIYWNSLMLNLVFLGPIALATVFFASMVLNYWLGSAYHPVYARVGEILALGVFINSFGHVSQAVVQAHGRPDLTAKLHIAELMVFVPYLYFLVSTYGASGAAVAWTIRVTIGAVVLHYLAQACLSGSIESNSI